MDLNVYLVALLIFFIIIYKFSTNNLDYFKKLNVPYKKPFPLFGNMDKQVIGKEHRLVTISRFYNEFSKYRFFGYFEGRNPKFVIRDPELIRQITVTDFDSFNQRITAFGLGGNPLVGKTLLGFQGKKWGNMRSTLSPTFTSAKIKQMYELMPEPLKQMVNYLKKETSKGPIVRDVKDIFTRFTNDVIATTGYGIKINSFEEQDNEFYKIGKDISNFSGTKIKIIMLGFILFPTVMKMLKLSIFSKMSEDFFHELIIDNIRKRDKGKIIRPDMINTLMQMRKNAPSRIHQKENKEDSEHPATKKIEWEDDELASQGILFFLAGFETVSSTLCFICHELAENPDVQKKLQDEIDDAMQLYANPSFDDIKQLKYLDMVILETMRKWPASPVLDRVCTKSYFIKDHEGRGIKIEKGTQIYFPTYAIHRDPQYFHDPDKFDPERFSAENMKNIRPFEYFPFGAGPRNCIGSRFALMEMKTILFHILAEFSFDICSKTSVPIILSHKNALLGPANGFWLEIKRRN